MILINKLRRIYSIIGISYSGKLKILCSKEFNNILDVGCGHGRPFLIIKRYRKIRFSVGLDINKNKIHYCASKDIHNCYVRADVRNIPFRDKCFDVVLSIDLIEHLVKEEGRKLLDELERIGKKQIIIHVPNGFMKTPLESKFERHRSAWSPKEFEKRGFKIFGSSGFKLPLKFKRIDLFKDLMKGNILFIVALLDNIVGEVIVYHIPRLAYQLFCVKDTKS